MDCQCERDFEERKQQASKIRDLTRDDASHEFLTEQPDTNGDEAKYAQLGFPGFASFSKALSHNDNGLVQKESFQSLLSAIQTGTQDAFESVQLGGCGEEARKLANPLNAYSFQLIGNDSNGARMAAAPSFCSRNNGRALLDGTLSGCALRSIFCQFSSYRRLPRPQQPRF